MEQVNKKSWTPQTPQSSSLAGTGPVRFFALCYLVTVFAANIYMLWFKFILGLMFFELVSIIFAIGPHYGNEYMTKENKN